MEDASPRVPKKTQGPPGRPLRPAGEATEGINEAFYTADSRIAVLKTDMAKELEVGMRAAAVVGAGNGLD